MLQGSIADFTLDEVLSLVSTTQKTGELRVEGDRGTGSLWLESGALSGATASQLDGSAEPDEVLFELLRFGTGTFSFVVGAVAADAIGPIDIDPVLEAALSRVGEWRSIASVVPSMHHVLSLADDLPGDKVTIDQDDWSTLRAVGEGSPVQQVCDDLSLDDVAGSRRIKDMIERSLLVISEPVETPSVPASAASALAPAPAPTEAPAVAPVVEAPTATPVAEPADQSVPVTDLAALITEKEAAGAPEPTPAPQAAPTFEPATFEPATFDPTSLVTDAERRPPMPTPPPSPAEIEQFGAELEEETFDPASLVINQGVDDGDEGDEGSLLMRYLKSDS